MKKSEEMKKEDWQAAGGAILILAFIAGCFVGYVEWRIDTIKKFANDGFENRDSRIRAVEVADETIKGRLQVLEVDNRKTEERFYNLMDYLKLEFYSIPDPCFPTLPFLKKANCVRKATKQPCKKDCD